MSEESFNSDDETQKMFLRWTSAGHETIPERLTFRHKEYRKDMDPEIIVHKDGAPLITGHGHTVRVGDVLPERADLALTEDGKVLAQHDFEIRYRRYLNWFKLVEGSDPGAEPMPNVVTYITQTPDTFSASGGMVEIGYDANKPADEVRTQHYDAVNDKLVDMVEEQGEGVATALDAVRQLLEDRKNELPKRGPGRPRKDTAA